MPASIHRPIGGGTCGNLRDATVVSSVGMCASYAHTEGNSGFCVVSGTQCFTSDDFQSAYDAAEQADCNTTNVMTCYSFESQSQTSADSRRSDQGVAKRPHAGTNRRSGDLTAVSTCSMLLFLSTFLVPFFASTILFVSCASLKARMST
jgi:hypothetical protein